MKRFLYHFSIGAIVRYIQAHGSHDLDRFAEWLTDLIDRKLDHANPETIMDGADTDLFEIPSGCADLCQKLEAELSKGIYFHDYNS
jgi:hypothetical protein